jgi:thiamine biosynthesis protein ThiI
LLAIADIDDAEKAAKELAQVFGVAHADACQRTPLDLSEISECVVKQAQQKLKAGETFAIRARNFEPSQIKGKEIEVRAGAEVLSQLPNGLKVNLSNPDHTLRVFYGAKEAFVSAARFDGPGGLPVGSQGRLLGLATDPACAPISFYLLMKRGAMVWPVIPNIPAVLGGTRFEDIIEGLRKLAPLVPKKDYYIRIMEIDDATSRILHDTVGSLQTVLALRLVYRALAHVIQTERVLGLVTADSLGRNGLDSLKDLRAFEDIVKFPVYRPLLTLDDESLNRELVERGLLQFVKPGTITQMGRVGLSGVSTENLRELEERLQVEDLAKRIADGSKRIQI